ncbi:GIY-YIG nuclease family protein [Microbacterium hominis]|uniref:GIY-YIG nuclease family protein n=1 Tax=Microbacterium hominis TaxID=162426 RepID=A0A7D4TSS5_9MICO|nr:GIY-YIG nuclease family protein [Microbacterium hominis]QKJ20944.1 GIY-YIG nuclease family protein [Microbacterium hominis]
MSESEACVLCGAGEVVSGADGRCCAACGWRVGDSPDPELPPPRVEVVYYLRWEQRIKIGTSSRPRQRLAAIWHQELLAFERGGRTLERERHRQFAELREGGEWFLADESLLSHIASIPGTADPWRQYARWMAEELRRTVS